MQRLGPAEHRGERLQGDPDQVDLGLLGGQLNPGGLGVEAQHHRPWLGRAEPFLHQPGPDPPGGPELRHLLQQRGPGDEEERQPRRDLVHRQPGGQRRLEVGDPVGQGEGHLLRRRRPGLGHVIAGDRDGVPARQVLPAVRERVADQAQRGLRRVDVGAAGDVLLEHVVLDRAAQPRRLDALLLGHQLVEQQQHRGRRVDGHRGGDLVQRDAREQPPHVLQRVDRHPDLADLAGGSRRIGVIAHLGGQVEGHRQSGGAVGDQLQIPGVGLRRRAEPRVLPHGPGPGDIHRRVDARG